MSRPTATARHPARFIAIVALLSPGLAAAQPAAPQPAPSRPVLPQPAQARPAAPQPAPPPSAPPLSSEQLMGIYDTAATIAGRVQCNVDIAVPFPEPDLTSARTLAQAAAMLDVVARNYPPAGPKADPGARAQRLAALILQTSQAYEQAYRCAPGYDQRHHLDNARALIAARLTTIREVEKRSTEARDYASLAERLSQLDKMTPSAPPPPVVETERPPLLQRTVQTPEPPTGYARFAGFLVLRPEIGFGTGSLQSSRDDEENDTSKFTGVFFNLFAAARLASIKYHHAFMIGGVFNMQQVAQRPHFEDDDNLDLLKLDENNVRSLTAGALRIEGALHAHPRWISLHPALELGVQAYVYKQKFGRAYIGPGFGICLDRELACFNAKFTTPLAAAEQNDAIIRTWQFGLGIDIMRIVDRVKGLATP